MVVQTNDRIYVLEFKFDKSPQEALDQILERRYHEKYTGQGKPLTLVGINFGYEDKMVVIQHVIQGSERVNTVGHVKRKSPHGRGS